MSRESDARRELIEAVGRAAAAVEALSAPEPEPAEGDLRARARHLARKMAQQLDARTIGVLSEIVGALQAVVPATEVEEPPAEVPTIDVPAAWRREVGDALTSSGKAAVPPVELVPTDVGELALPAYDEVVLPALRDHGVWEAEVGAWLRQQLKPGMTVVNVGAHVGYYALLAAQAVGPTGRVLAFEPEPVNQALLRLNIARNHAWNVTAIPAAAGDNAGVIELTQSPDNSGDHRAFRRAGADPSTVVEVPQVTVDSVVGDHRVDLAIIDTQGTDHLVIEGMRGVIEKWWPLMFVEFWPPGIEEAGANPGYVIEGYRSIGYDVAVHDQPALGPTPHTDDILNAAATNRGEYIDLILTKAQA